MKQIFDKSEKNITKPKTLERHRCLVKRAVEFMYKREYRIDFTMAQLAVHKNLY